MIKKAMYQQIKTLKKQGINMNEMSKRLGLDFRTVRRYYKMSESEYRTYRNNLQQRTKLFEDHEQEILDLYSGNGNRKLNIAAVYDYLDEIHGKLPGTEKTLRNYVHFLIQVDKLILN